MQRLQALSGSIGPATNWRVPFVVVAAPSLVMALVMQLTTTEPPRGAFEEALQERWVWGRRKRVAACQETSAFGGSTRSR